MRNFKLGTIALLACSAAFVLPQAGASAKSGSEDKPVVVTAAVDPSVRVSYADLDLASKSGQKRLARRIAAAADDLCIVNGTQPLDSLMAGWACRDGAVEAAKPQVAAAIARFDKSGYAEAGSGSITVRRM